MGGTVVDFIVGRNDGGVDGAKVVVNDGGVDGVTVAVNDG